MKWLDTGVSHQFEPDEQSKKKGKDIMTSLRGKVALVVGGSSGVGKATVKALLSEGAHVTAVARGADNLRVLKTELGDGLAPIQEAPTDSPFSELLLSDLRPALLSLA